MFGRHRYARSGDLTIELLAAIALLFAVWAVSAQWQHWITQASRQMRQQQQALLAIDNALEVLADIPWDELDKERANGALAEAGNTFGTPKIFVDVIDEKGTPPAKRIEVWVPRPGQPGNVPLAQLSLWRFRP